MWTTRSMSDTLGVDLERAVAGFGDGLGSNREPQADQML
jgi:hypothetical protein